MREKSSNRAGCRPFIWLLLIFALLAPGRQAAGEADCLKESFSAPTADYRLAPGQENQSRDLLSSLPFAPPARLTLPAILPTASLPRLADAFLLPPALILPEVFLPRPPPLS